MASLDYLSAPLDLESGFGFSPATSPARDHGKQDIGGYFSSAMNDPLPGFLDQDTDSEFFDNYTSGNLFQQLSNATNGFPSVNAKVINGQVTPPSDNSPVAPKQEMDNEPTPVRLDEVAPAAPVTRKKRAAQSSQTPPSAPTMPKRRKTSRKQSSESTSSKDEKDDKRSKFLERNRVAASKCRQKKKEWTSNLEQRARDLQQNKTHLSLLVNSLRDEVLYLKSEVLKHDHCNCTALRNYMNRSVSQISGEGAPAGKTLPSAEESPIPELDLDGMSFAGSPPLNSSRSSTENRRTSSPT